MISSRNCTGWHRSRQIHSGEPTVQTCMVFQECVPPVGKKEPPFVVLHHDNLSLVRSFFCGRWKQGIHSPDVRVFIFLCFPSPPTSRSSCLRNAGHHCRRSLGFGLPCWSWLWCSLERNAREEASVTTSHDFMCRNNALMAQTSTLRCQTCGLRMSAVLMGSLGNSRLSRAHPLGSTCLSLFNHFASQSVSLRSIPGARTTSSWLQLAVRRCQVGTYGCPQALRERLLVRTTLKTSNIHLHADSRRAPCTTFPISSANFGVGEGRGGIV